MAFSVPCFAQIPNEDDSWASYYSETFGNWDNNNWFKSPPTSGRSGWVMPYWSTPSGYETYDESHVFITGSSGPLNLLVDYVSGGWVTGSLVTNVQEDEPENYGFGYYEAEIKLPIGNGLWPAFWLYNEDHDNPTPIFDCTYAEEIDIMESLQKPSENNNTHYVGHNLHWSEDDLSCSGGALNGGLIPDGDEFYSPSNQPITNFNKYAVEWSPNLLIWYFNDIPFRELYFDERIPSVDHTQIHLTIGRHPGYATGTPAIANPCTMQVNHVKVWELSAAANCTTSTSHLNITSQTNLNNYDHKVRYSVKVNPTTSVAVPNNSNVVFRAKNHIEITKNFSVDVGESATFLIHGCP